MRHLNESLLIQEFFILSVYMSLIRERHLRAPRQLIQRTRYFVYLGDITTSAILHLASTVPRKLQFSATDFNSYNTVASGLFLSPQKDGVRSSNGQKMSVPKSHPGLGIEPNWKILGEPLFVIQ